MATKGLENTEPAKVDFEVFWVISFKKLQRLST